MKKLLATVLAGLLLITLMTTMVWADDDGTETTDWDTRGIEFDSLTELIEYIDWLKTDFATDHIIYYESRLLGYLYYAMDGVYLPDGVDLNEISIYVDPDYVSITFKRDEKVLELRSFIMGEDGKSETEGYVYKAKVSGIVTTLDNGTEVYFCKDIGAGSYVFVQGGVYYQLYNWLDSTYDETVLEYCNASYHGFREAYNLTGETVLGKIKLSWDGIVDDATYTIYWKNSSSDEWKVAGTTSKHKVNITGLKSGVSYDFKIEATGIESEVVTVTAE
ncbi:MAG: fibronectin type III domain-containing protein [Oscillospiraceae bacterium]|nr:fibronectin type III domain-containing protein [Oscillospiraceae bacterium]